jgi:hypothetical protein
LWNRGARGLTAEKISNEATDNPLWFYPDKEMLDGDLVDADGVALFFVSPANGSASASRWCRAHDARAWRKKSQKYQLWRCLWHLAFPALYPQQQNPSTHDRTGGARRTIKIG